MLKDDKSTSPAQGSPSSLPPPAKLVSSDVLKTLIYLTAGAGFLWWVGQGPVIEKIASLSKVSPTSLEFAGQEHKILLRAQENSRRAAHAQYMTSEFFSEMLNNIIPDTIRREIEYCKAIDQYEVHREQTDLDSECLKIKAGEAAWSDVKSISLHECELPEKDSPDCYRILGLATAQKYSESLIKIDEARGLLYMGYSRYPQDMFLNYLLGLFEGDLGNNPEKSIDFYANALASARARVARLERKTRSAYPQVKYHEVLNYFKERVAIYKSDLSGALADLKQRKLTARQYSQEAVAYIEERQIHACHKEQRLNRMHVKFHDIRALVLLRFPDENDAEKDLAKAISEFRKAHAYAAECQLDDGTLALIDAHEDEAQETIFVLEEQKAKKASAKQVSSN